jgi:hypothetical protein
MRVRKGLFGLAKDNTTGNDVISDKAGHHGADRNSGAIFDAIGGDN